MAAIIIVTPRYGLPPTQKATDCKCGGVDFSAADFDSYTPFSYDAVWAIASAAHAYYEREGRDATSPTGEQLKEELLKIWLERQH